MKCALFSVLAVSVMLACESDRPFAPKPPGIAPAISDGGHGGGNQHFFFLPPMVPPLGEHQPPPFSGVFDPTLAPVVQICQLGTNGVCAPVQTFPFGGAFNPSQPLSAFTSVHLAALAQSYFVLWRPNWGPSFDPTRTYRVTVQVNSQSLGLADVKVVTSLAQFQAVWASKQFVPLLQGGVLAIVFRIEQGALQATQCSGQPDCVQQTVAPNPTTTVNVVTPSGQAAVSFPPGYFGQSVALTVSRVSEGCFSASNPAAPFQDFGCYKFTTSPTVAASGCIQDNPDPTKCARVEVCPTLTPGDPNYQHLQLFRSDADRPATPVVGAAASLVTCTPTPIGLGVHGIGNFARASWRRLMIAASRMLTPQPAFAATVVIDEGLGGLVPGFSNIGWALPLAVTAVTPMDQTAAAGAILPVSIVAQFMHPASRVPAVASGVQVGFTVTSGNGTVSSASETTGPTGIASTNWTLPSSPGTYTLQAMSPGASPVNFTATGLAVGIVSASVSSALDIGGLEGTATVSVRNGTGESVSGLVVEGWIRQGSVRQAAGTSGEPFTCATVTCTQSFNFVASSPPEGQVGLVCGPATAEFELKQGETLLHTYTIPITLDNRGGCP